MNKPYSFTLRMMVSAIFAFLLAVSLARADTVKLKLSELVDLGQALASLDGFDKEVHQGKDQPAKIIRGAYSFNAKTAWAIADDIAEVKRGLATFEEARKTVIKSISPDGTAEAIDKDKALGAKYSAEITKLLELEKPFTFTLISRDDLNIDVNNTMPASLLTRLAPIIKKP